MRKYFKAYVKSQNKRRGAAAAVLQRAVRTRNPHSDRGVSYHVLQRCAPETRIVTEVSHIMCCSERCAPETRNPKPLTYKAETHMRQKKDSAPTDDAKP